MALLTRQDWSDDDDDDAIRTETSVFLGIPDGLIESASDLKDVAVSRIGGLPVRFIPITVNLHFVEYIQSMPPGFTVSQSPV